MPTEVEKQRWKYISLQTFRLFSVTVLFTPFTSREIHTSFSTLNGFFLFLWVLLPLFGQMLLRNVVGGFAFHIYRHLFHFENDINSFYEPKRILNDKRDLALCDLDYGFGSFSFFLLLCLLWQKRLRQGEPKPNRNQKEESNKNSTKTKKITT